jgi:beta-1,4-mannosyltransferase
MAPADRGNPYQALLAEALSEGAAVSFDNRIRLRQVARADARQTIVHLHWLEFLVRSTDPGPLAAARSMARSLHLLLALAVARLRRIRIVWTVHNLDPHEGGRRWIDRPLARAVGRLADSVLAHSTHCAERIAGRLGREDVEVAYHGNYLGAYPQPRRSRAETRRLLGLPETAHVLLAFGQIRPYKRIPELIAEFGTLADPDFRLLVAGQPADERMRMELEEDASVDARVVLRLGRVPDAEVAELHLAADAAVLAYRDVFSSGALMLALSNGLPVIAPRNSTADELGAPPAVRLFSPGCLARALVESAPSDAAARASAMRSAERHGWGEMAAKVLGEGRRAR